MKLKIKPQINEGDAVKLEIEQEISSLDPTARAASGASDVVTNKRSIKTNVMVNDGDVVVLGGLIKDDLLESEQRVPGLGDIPILGWLFKYKKVSKVKTNLMVFIHPVIMKNDLLSKTITNNKYNYLRARQLEQREKGLGIMSSDEVPVLKEMKDWLNLPPPYEEIQSNLPRVPKSLKPTTAPLPPNNHPAAEVGAPPGE